MKKEPIKNLEELSFYVIRNSQGLYFRRKGYQGWGDSWTDDLAKARIYSKISQARTVITYFANRYSHYPLPDLIEIAAGAVTVLDETERVAKSKARKAQAEAKHKEYMEKEKLRVAERELAYAEERLRKLKAAAAPQFQPIYDYGINEYEFRK